MSEHRSNTVCAVVEWPDHHCGDDLVMAIVVGIVITVVIGTVNSC